MYTAITEGVQISVNTQFRPDLSRFDLGFFFFNYQIEIRNKNNFQIQLIHRYWCIFDSLNDFNFVSGEGVVGEQPLILPNESFVYTSSVELSSEIGYMQGFYTFHNLATETYFQVNVPTFQLIFPPRMN
jgi:ApaG protein